MRKTPILEWLVIFMFLLFIPGDNSVLLLDTKQEDWYGEIVIPQGDKYTLIAKNSTNEAMNIGFSATNIISYHEDQAIGQVSSESSIILPESISVVETPSLDSQEKRVITTASKYYFRPQPLSIMTRSDLHNAYLLVGGLFGGFLALGFLLASLGGDEIAYPQIDE